MKKPSIPAALVLLAGVATTAAIAADEPRLVGTDDTPTLFVNSGARCEEDYGAELRAAGIGATVRTFASLRSLVKFVGVPGRSDAKHLLLMGGLAVVDHVAPSVLARTLEERPPIAGIIGSSACATEVDHSTLDAEAVRVF